ncbi:MAG TPA: GTPase ObgE [Candidatus Paceibacterota bacterium]|nr:GTPase ObgE [Candidatus Paceibacterota bacterium]
MALVDELHLHARAGRGGDGVVRWLHLKGKEFSGPAGGNGGDGGNVYVSGVRDIALLSRYRGEKKFEAEDGGDGQSLNMHGKNGKDLTIEVPVGSLIKNFETGEEYEVLEEKKPIMILKGGRGGAGNAVFKSSVNQSPEESTPGVAGEEAEIRIELRLIADAGLVGLPNAGKTSLLNALTGAVGKVAPYAFTTLDPNLGALYGKILADIPGLIEGASDGRGLGFKFLRHISRTRILIHCISLESNDLVRDYEVVRRELDSFEGGILSKKPELVVLTKTDTRTPQEVDEAVKLMRGKNPQVTTVSVIDDESIKRFQDLLAEVLR